VEDIHHIVAGSLRPPIVKQEEMMVIRKNSDGTVWFCSLYGRHCSLCREWRALPRCSARGAAIIVVVVVVMLISFSLPCGGALRQV